VVWCGSSLTYRGLRGGEALLPFKAAEQLGEVSGGEPPIERFGQLLVAALELEEPCLHVSQVGEVVRREDLALDHREVDLDLVEPRAVDRQVDEPQVAMPGPEPLGALGPRWAESLSTIQNTRRAEVYGSVAITCATSRSKETMMVTSSHHPNRATRCTSSAAR
jgi:hypothetical protein